MHAHSLGQRPEYLQSVQGLIQQWRAVAVCRDGDGSEWDAVGIYDRRAFEALFTLIYRAFARFLATTGSFGDAAIDGHIGQLQADEPIVSLEYQLSERVRNPRVDSLVASAA